MSNPATGTLLTKAGQYADSFGIKDRASEGRGAEYNNTLLSTAFKRISQNTVSSLGQSGANDHARGMEFSGSRIKNTANIAGQGAAESFEAVNRVSAEDEAYKLENAGRWINILQHEDNYSLQLKQLEAQEGDIFDTLGRVGSLLALI
jgi:hypothetical protein